MDKIIELRILKNFQLFLKFSDGLEKIIDIKPMIEEGISKPLENETFFKQVQIESGGGLVWPNGFDICPKFLKDYTPEEDQLKNLNYSNTVSI